MCWKVFMGPQGCEHLSWKLEGGAVQCLKETEDKLCSLEFT